MSRHFLPRSSALTRPGSAIFLLALLPLSQEHPVLTLPPGPLPVLDGSLGPGEWDDAEALSMGEGGTVFFRAVEGGIAVGIRGPAPGLAHLALAQADTVRILHASAALGEVVYVRRDDGWEKVQDPVWEVRDPSQSIEAKEAREAYLASNGWVGTTAYMGAASEIEFLMRIPTQDLGPCWLAVVYLPVEPVGSPAVWPATARDEVSALRLLTGPMPETLSLDPSTWARIGRP